MVVLEALDAIKVDCNYNIGVQSVRPDWAIFCTLGNHLKMVVRIILPKSPTLLRNFCKGAKIIHFSSEIIFGQLL